MAQQKFSTFNEFYPFYLSEHGNLTCRRLHFAGSWVAIFCILTFASQLNFAWLAAGITSGYAFAWVGHFFYEKNKPASFRQPFYSFMGDWVMFRDILRGKVKI